MNAVTDHGYNGRVAYVDLTRETITVTPLAEDMAHAYLGGTGLAARLVYDLLADADYTALRADPFDPRAPVVFATGPVTGTLRPSSGRYAVGGISPLMQSWGEGTSGGHFCLALRRSGYDALVVTGSAARPTYLAVVDGKITFEDAAGVWGLDTYATQDRVRALFGDVKVKVACIGQAGEHRVKYAAIINDEGRAQGRCGFGALMGAKHLKAVAVRAGKPPRTPDPALIRETRQAAQAALHGDLLATVTPQLYTLYGTNSYLDIGMMLGDAPAYYFTRTEFVAEHLTEKTLAEQYPQFQYACAGCTRRCGKSHVIPAGTGEKAAFADVGDSDATLHVDGPEYETVCAYGPLCGVLTDAKAVMRAGHLCNVHGIDTISGGVALAFLIYLVEHDLAVDAITPYLQDLRLEDLRWGNPALLPTAVDLVSRRAGIGALLAEGVRAMADRLGVDPELAAHVKGLEIPMHDPRANAGQALSYVTSCCGANHNKGDWFQVELGVVAHPGLRVKPGRKGRYDITRREKGVAALQDLRAIDDAAVHCNFLSSSLANLVAYVNGATGFAYNKKTLLRVGARINTLKRLIACKMGITRADDRLPAHVTRPLDHGKTKGVALHLERNLQRYYRVRGWDWETGAPTPETVADLGIAPPARRA